MSYRKTVQNLCLAFLFNGIGVPLAATGLVHPSWAMTAMALSVSLVLANSFGGRLLGRGAAGLAGGASASPARAGGATDAEVTLRLPAIHCRGCVETIEAGLAAEPGIGRVEGSVEKRTVRVAYRGQDTSAERIEAALERLGYRVAGREGA